MNTLKSLIQDVIDAAKKEITDDTEQLLSEEHEDNQSFNVARALMDDILDCIKNGMLTRNELKNILKHKRDALEEEYGSDNSLTDEQLAEIVDLLELHELVKPKKLCEMDSIEFIDATYDHIQSLIDMVSDYPYDNLYTRSEWKRVIRGYCNRLTENYHLEPYEPYDDIQITWIIDFLDENGFVRH